jgi:sugar lactone lactonase YvrE
VRDELELVLDAGLELGEGPIWDDERQLLLFVDIMQGDVHTFDPATGVHRVVSIGRPVGAVALTTRGDWVLAAERGFYRADPGTGRAQLIVEVEPEEAGTRMNDGFVDPSGRFWAGTASLVRQRERGALYRLDPGGDAERVLSPVTTSNGIDWSPDGRLMYYVDTGTKRVDLFDFDAATGLPHGRRPCVVFAGDAGRPDGLIVDAEGAIWVALWEGGAIHRYTAAGRLDRVVDVPAALTTKCAFGGPSLTDLYITTASRGLDAAARRAQPHAGGLFRLRGAGRGQSPRRFAG